MRQGCQEMRGSGGGLNVANFTVWLLATGIPFSNHVLVFGAMMLFTKGLLPDNCIFCVKATRVTPLNPSEGISMFAFATHIEWAT